MSKIFKDEQDLVSIEHAFQNVINKIDKLEHYYGEEMKKIKKDLKKNRLTKENINLKQEQFEQYTYSLRTIINVRRIIEDELFIYDLELEESEE